MDRAATQIHLIRRRLANQQIASPRFRDAAALVRWMGAVQAQDAPGGAWAIGLRLRGGTLAAVEGAIAARAIVRTWPMRRTLHFVAAEDARWMLALLTPRLLPGNAGRYRSLELAPADFTRARRILERALRDGARLTREGVYGALRAGGVSPAGQRGIHVVAHLAQEGLICFGPREGKQPTLVLLEDWIPAAPRPSREEALARLATAYFRSHGPATLADFAWWSGLLVKDAQAAIREAGAALVAESHGGRATWMGTARIPRAATRMEAALLPPWDEYLVAYKDREAALGRLRTVKPMVIGNALVAIDGRVVGSWRRVAGPSGVRVSFDFWTTVTPGERRALAEAAEHYGRFLGREVAVAPSAR
jgi:hypothetical protein